MKSFSSSDGSVLSIVSVILSFLPGLVSKEVNEAELEKIVLASEIALPLLSTPQVRISAALKSVIANQANIFTDPNYAPIAVEVLTWFETLVGGSVSLAEMAR